MLLFDTTDDKVIHVRMIVKHSSGFFKRLRFAFQKEAEFAIPLVKREEVKAVADNFNEWLDRGKAKRKTVSDSIEGQIEIPPDVLLEN